MEDGKRVFALKEIAHLYGYYYVVPSEVKFTPVMPYQHKLLSFQRYN